MAETIIETQRLRLRTWDAADVEPFMAALNTPSVMQWLGGVQSRAEFDAFVHRMHDCQAEYGHCFWITERRQDAELLGFCGLKRTNSPGAPMPGVHEIGWRLREDAQGMGYAREAAEATLAHAFGPLGAPFVVALTVRENLQMALLSHHRALAGWWRPAAGRYRAEIEALLDELGMADQGERACGVLAYGDLKRVELAMALAHGPRLLLMDEPTAGMAPRERIALMALTARLARERTIAVLFTEHDMDVVFAHADRILVLDHGRVIAAGPPGQVRADPAVRRVYLGGTPLPPDAGAP